ncbi:toll/interleukin-1 receptor domain-containing protein [Dactylosporangium aurantiacum]|uniref:Toll/interleukin-1 receptor domain-containing protein n=1 Tax=Dactylosporangium aurantiacum TaxID=35754 RepID=A0A9Q9M9B3_9ACTN|nr:TIR-like protein FxsC [Dactylosporangium aurantiacum]MDG6106401.1 TIR-like protein FxsC [Dactylosporangium aurantiacum]UWZ50558.1 toll/interleukin-1 receptor domain-containing protein [Dactylosporangium aurantiacum]
MPEVEPDLDATAPLFFLSYARMTRLRRGPIAQPDPNLRVKQLFTDLSSHLNNLVYRETGADPGFMDLAMTGGEEWRPELLHAVGTCQVFVALLSPAYMKSEYCALEWNAFTERPIHRRPGAPGHHETSVIPVVWLPSQSGTVPAAINKIQRFTPQRLPDENLAQQYADEGLYGLLTLGAEGTDGIILRLAQQIRDLCWSHQVERRVLPDTKNISRTFR